MSWYWKESQPEGTTWQHIIVIFWSYFLLIDWSSFREGKVHLKLDIQDQREGKILGIDGQGGWRRVVMIIRRTTHTTSVKNFFLLIRSKVSLVRSEKMLWSYPIFVFIKFSEFSHLHASNLEFHWSKVWSVVHPNLSRMESLMFFQAFKPLDNVCVVHPDNHHPNKFFDVWYRYCNSW